MAIPACDQKPPLRPVAYLWFKISRPTELLILNHPAAFFPLIHGRLFIFPERDSQQLSGFLTDKCSLGRCSLLSSPTSAVAVEL